MSARICVASHHDSLSALLADAEFARLAKADGLLLELRLDQYADLTPAGLAQALKSFGTQNLLVTYRMNEEGGRRAGVDDATRLSFISAAADAGVAYVDVELATARRFEPARQLLRRLEKSSGTQSVVSFHNFTEVPTLETLRLLRQSAEDLGAGVVKFAVMPKVILDALPLLDLLNEGAGWTRPCLGLAMGEAGLWSRVLGPLFPHPAPFTFARAEGSLGTAPGQPTWRELSELYRFAQLRPGTPVYGVIGAPIAHSRSPLMHNTALRERGLEGVYLPFKVEGDAAAFVRDFAPKVGVRGLSVTLPHKEALFSICAEIDPLARQVGALNTLVLRKGGWYATNTDASAAAASLEAALGGPGALKDRTVLILGAGGAAKAVAFGVKALGANVLVANRTFEKARKLADDVGGQCVQYAALKGLQADAVVNTTPLGMSPNLDTCALEKEEIPPGSLVFDTVYNPLRTKLLRLAEERGSKTLSGLAMFVGQGAAQFELFTGQSAPRESMERVVRAALEAPR